MLKNMVKWSFGRVGYDVVSTRTRAELARLQAAAAALAAERDGYKAAYESVLATDLGKTRIERDGYKAAYEAVCSQPVESVTDSIRPAPPVARRLKDTPGLAAEVRAEAQRLGLPDAVVAGVSDPDFSVEDRGCYRRLFEHARPVHWDRLGSVVARVIDRQYLQWRPRSADPAAARGAADALRREGYARVDPLLSPAQVAEVQAYFLRRGVHNGHIPTSARHRVLRRFVGHTAEDFPLGSYTAEDIALAPHLLELAFSPFVLDAAADYLGCAPRLCWLQSWWNFAGPGDYPHRQNGYHRDSTDFRMFWVYMYLTDVDAGSGPHRLLRRSGDYEALRQRLAEASRSIPQLARALADPTLDADHCLGALGCSDSNKAVEELFAGLVEEVTGPAGTTFFSRGIDLHKVCTPLARKRQILALRYTMTEFPELGPHRDGDPLPGHILADRVGADEQLRYASGLLFDWHPKPTA